MVPPAVTETVEPVALVPVAEQPQPVEEPQPEVRTPMPVPRPNSETVERVRIEHPVPEPAVSSVRVVEPLDEVDRWILDEERVDDLYPVDAP